VEAVLLIGIQGSGKTTFYKERFFDTHVRVSLDMLKTRSRERLLVGACLAAKQPFVVDNTNAAKSRRADFIAAAKAAGFRVVGYYLRCELKDAMRRNLARGPGKAIPPAGVAGTFKRLEPPSLAEGFDELHLVEIDAEGRFVVREWDGV
jgi:tRNA uridine 5-carbamoylmethylation protein Kti12